MKHEIFRCDGCDIHHSVEFSFTEQNTSLPFRKILRLSHPRELLGNVYHTHTHTHTHAHAHTHTRFLSENVQVTSLKQTQIHTFQHNRPACLFIHQIPKQRKFSSCGLERT